MPLCAKLTEQVVGHVARLPARVLNSASVAYLAIRGAYVWFYLNNTNSEHRIGLLKESSLPFLGKQTVGSAPRSDADHATDKTATRRSLSWTASNLVCLTIFALAGLKLKDGY